MTDFDCWLLLFLLFWPSTAFIARSRSRLQLFSTGAIRGCVVEEAKCRDPVAILKVFRHPVRLTPRNVRPAILTVLGRILPSAPTRRGATRRDLPHAPDEAAHMTSFPIA